MESAENKQFVYEFGRFILSPHEKTLLNDGMPIHLPAKEFETLLLLVENNGKALSKERMMSTLWQDAFVEEGNLAKKVSKLRKILNTNGDRYIETIPKHGYRFSADLRIVESTPESPVILERRTIKRVTFAIENDPKVVPALPAATNRAAPIFAIAAVIGLVALLGAAMFYSSRTGAAAPDAIDTIAVLPLKPLGGDENDRALGLGLTDALITKLGSLKQIVVRPTGAIVGFGGASPDPLSAGQKLGVDAVLEGTIQRAEGRLRVTARLIDAKSGKQIWSDKFDEPSGGIFALQDALSARIARTLAFELTKIEGKRLTQRGTENADAYERFLRGRFYQTQNTGAGLTRAIELYQEAIALDPNFAEAHAGIADANVILFNFGMRPASETIPQARESLSRALSLDPELSNAYTAHALIQFLVDKDWAGAEKSLDRAIEINPSNADAYHRYGYFLMRLGRFDEALAKFGKALELNPLSAISQSSIGLTYLCARRYPEAIEQLERTKAENPQFSHPQWLLATSYEAIGDKEKAFETNLHALELDGGAEFAARLRSVKDSEGIEAADRFWLSEIVKSGVSKSVSPLTMAMRAATVKDRELTLKWLERALAEDDITLGAIRFLSKFDFVRDDPRFRAVDRQLNF